MSRSSGPAATYVPGVCNIGPAEIARRRRSGWVGVAVTIAVWTVLVVLDAPPALRLLVALPAAGAALGFIQAALHFCAVFGFRSLFNVEHDAGHVDTVVEAEFRTLDRRRARRIAGYSAAAGVVVGLLAYLL